MSQVIQARGLRYAPETEEVLMDPTCSIQTISGEEATSLGLAGNPDTASRFVDASWSVGVNYYFFYNATYKEMIQGLRRIAAQERERVIIATGIEVREKEVMRQYLDQMLGMLGIETIDVFFTEYVSPSDNLKSVLGENGALDELRSWKDEGLIRYVGATAHSRPLSVALLESGKIDILMHRYNMAHRGSEDEVLPTASRLGIPVVAFTCTRWGSLLEGHREWAAQVPTAGDCYRYVLNHPSVRVALSAPATGKELQENLQAFTDGLGASPAQIAEWEAYGKLVYGSGNDAFETRWP